jgi:hypothetical protein
MKNKRIDQLQLEVDLLDKRLESEKLLYDIYLELGPYTPHLPDKLLIRLQRHFDFDDSE